MRDAIEMARESHLDVYGLGKSHAKFVEALERFAALVRADERELRNLRGAGMRSVNDVARDEDLIRRIKALGGGSYQDVAYLRDGTIIGIGDLMFTRAIYIDLDLNGWGKRFCFEDRDLAVAEYAKLQTGDDEPTGWVARRGR